MEYRSTREVAKLLGVNPSRLARAIWDGRVPAPERGPSGAFLWIESDIRQAARILLHRELEDILAEHGEETLSPLGSKPPLKVAEEEAAIRRAGKGKIAARYGFSSWGDAPAAALREYQRFLKIRMSDPREDEQ